MCSQLSYPLYIPSAWVYSISMKAIIKDNKGKHEVHAIGCSHVNLTGSNRFGVNASILEGVSAEDIITADMGGADDRTSYKVFPCLK